MRCAAGYMLENPSIPRYSSATRTVTMRRVRTTSRKLATPVTRILRDHTPAFSYATEKMRWSELYGDVEG